MAAETAARLTISVLSVLAEMSCYSKPLFQPAFPLVTRHIILLCTHATELGLALTGCLRGAAAGGFSIMLSPCAGSRGEMPQQCWTWAALAVSNECYQLGLKGRNILMSTQSGIQSPANSLSPCPDRGGEHVATSGLGHILTLLTTISATSCVPKPQPVFQQPHFP